MFKVFGVDGLSHVQCAEMDNYLVAAMDQVWEFSSRYHTFRSYDLNLSLSLILWCVVCVTASCCLCLPTLLAMQSIGAVGDEQPDFTLWDSSNVLTLLLVNVHHACSAPLTSFTATSLATVYCGALLLMMG